MNAIDTIKKFSFQLFCALLLTNSYSFAYLETSLKPEECKAINITISKSGTHLISKCLSLLLDRSFDWRLDLIHMPFEKSFHHVTEDDLYTLIEESKKVIWQTHLVYKPEYAAILAKTKTPFFVGYRDPRDQVISLVRMIKVHPESYDNSHFNMDDLIMDVMANGNFLRKGSMDLYSRYLPWFNVPGCYPVRFENLVGGKGGGSNAQQIQEIKNMAKHIGLIITTERAQEVADQLFGDTWTFNMSKQEKGEAGQINSWKRYFNEEHKKLFKKIAGQLLIDLGYEQDFNW